MYIPTVVTGNMQRGSLVLAIAGMQHFSLDIWWLCFEYSFDCLQVLMDGWMNIRIRRDGGPQCQHT